MMFENIKDDWRDKSINCKVQTEREKEIEAVLNRFSVPPKERENKMTVLSLDQDSVSSKKKSIVFNLKNV